ncbi:fibroblast growth factor 18, partial [Biomphalaria pfeifferi]
VGKHIQCLFKEKDIAGGYIELVSAVNDRWKVGFNKKGRKLKGLFHLKPKIQNCYMFKKVRCTRCS